jgi:Tol biopolymer transport system component
MRGLARLVLVCGVVAVPSAAAASAPQVAFKQLAGQRYGVVVVDQTGGGAVELTRGRPEPSVFGAFSWSPDGARIVYASDGLAGGDLYALEADGSGSMRLTRDGGNLYPAWSPDGRRIAYVHTVRVRQPAGGYRLDEDVWLVDSDGGNAHALTHDAGSKYSPAWSPDGSHILYWGSGTYVVDADTGRVVLHTNDAGGSWSPDGSHLALATGRGIDVANADGTGRHAVAGAGAAGPVWSPEGTRIAFTRSHCTPGVKGLCGTVLHSVYVVGADGSGERRLTGPFGGPGSEQDGFPNDNSESPVWWPDGSQLFFFAGTAAYAMNADGTCQRRFGPEGLLLASAAWRPGAAPSVKPSSCVDLAVRATPERGEVGLRGDALVFVTVENHGNEGATGVKLMLRLEYGRGRIRPPLPSCRGTAVVECDLASVPARGSTQLDVHVADPKPLVFHLQARVTEAGADSNPGSNTTLAYVGVLDCDVVGTSGADTLAGTPGRDSICGLPGADVIRAGAGNDRIEGGSGGDTIYPGPGRDVVAAWEGNDRIYARDGERDVIDCGPQRDTVYADRVDKLSSCERIVR